jgi:hypothetical protein
MVCREGEGRREKREGGRREKGEGRRREKGEGRREKGGKSFFSPNFFQKLTYATIPKMDNVRTRVKKQGQGYGAVFVPTLTHF